MQWIVGLNTLRFLAILLVIIYHLFHAFLPGGFIAVEIFFGLSGFLVVSKVLQSYRGQNKFKYGRFLWERFLRLWPPLLFCVFLALILALFVQSDIVAGIFLVVDNAFEVGDIVVIDGFRGHVKEIGLKSTK